VKGLVPEVVEQKLREKLEPAYKFHDASIVEAAADEKSNKKTSDKKRKKKA